MASDEQEIINSIADDANQDPVVIAILVNSHFNLVTHQERWLS